MREIKSPNVVALTRLAPPQTNREAQDDRPASRRACRGIGQRRRASERASGTDVARRSPGASSQAASRRHTAGVTRVIRFHAASSRPGTN